ncbi:GLoBin related [Aphelenchoides bicaudatus]|nr:GLoBin related [Aphelenchoides bicaudatus]
MNLVGTNSTRPSRRPSATGGGLRRGSRLRGDAESWHSSSCRHPSSSHTYLIQQQERYLHQQIEQQNRTYLYKKQPPGRDLNNLPNSARPLPLPIIQVTREARRTSISSPLRFTRTVSSDSIDSLEKRCIQEIKLRIMETERPRLFSQSSMVVESQKQIVKRQLSYNPQNIQSPDALAQSTATRLQSIGRSKTDPENGSPTSQDGSTVKCLHAQSSLQRSPPSLSLPLGAEKKTELGTKRSTPDLVLEGVLKNRVLSEVIGLSVYQQRLLLQCWPNIYSTGTNGFFAANLYSNLCNKNAKAKQLMQKADGVSVFSQSGMDCTQLHTKLTIELVDQIIRNLDGSPGPIIAYLNEIGQAHKSLKSEGISVNTWDDFGDALLDGVRKNDLVRKHKELRRAWLALIAFICDNIKQGQTLFRSSPSVEIAEIRLQ